MSHSGISARVIVAIVIGALLVHVGPAPDVRAVTTPDRSAVVLVLDFSASILKDAKNRARFAAALERIAARVDETSADLVAGDTTVSIVQFAKKAIDYGGCSDLKLLDSPETVARFANCLRSVAGAYRKGLNPKLTKRIGVDTNYVAAMGQAARHLPLTAVRPAMILFTDGKHDVKGVPVSKVQPTRGRLFGARSPFALLPVGMGLQSKERKALEKGLVRLKIIKAMPACVSGAIFDWPQVVFKSADAAGNAVAVALQDATCTFTVEPQAPAPTPAPTPAPAIGAVASIRLTPGDSRIEVAWSAAGATGTSITGYKARCGTGDGNWVESNDGVTLDRTAVVDGLANGTAYHCEVAAVGPSTQGPWTAASSTAMPFGRPVPPSKPAVEPLSQALRISVTPVNPATVSSFHYECSNNNGTTWPAALDVASTVNPVGEIDGLTNGVDYVCRAYAVNASGQSDASQVSDAVKPCGSAFQCNPVLLPIFAVLGIALAIGLTLTFVALLRIRRRGYVLAVVDVVHTANLGFGSKLGMGFLRDPGTKQVTGVVADRSRSADIRIHRQGGGRFVVTDRTGRHAVMDGQPIIVVDPVGGRHEVVFRAFNTNAASAVSSRT